jgi:hypothetical protein
MKIPSGDVLRHFGQIEVLAFSWSSILGLLAVMTLSSSCASEELQRFRERMDVAFDTAKKTMETAEQGTKTGDYRQTGRDFLIEGMTERSGYGLYSYFLFGSPPSDEVTLARYRAVLEAYFLMTPVRDFGRNNSRSRLNITYLPINTRNAQSSLLTTSDIVEWGLRNYDYDHAIALLDTLPGSHRNGPYIISCLEPLSKRESLIRYLFQPSGRYLVQDLSKVHPRLIHEWVQRFFVEVYQERHWDVDTAEALALRIRNEVQALSGIFGEQQGSEKASEDRLKAWVIWTP